MWIYRVSLRIVFVLIVVYLGYGLTALVANAATMTRLESWRIEQSFVAPMESPPNLHKVSTHETLKQKNKWF